MRLIRLPLMMAVVCSFSYAVAQKSVGSIQGSVLAASKKMPIADAVVTVSSPVLQGSRIVLTDSAGNYTISNLVAGTYTLSFEMEGFKTLVKNNILLPEGDLVNVRIDMVRAGTKEKGSTREKVVYVSKKNDF